MNKLWLFDGDMQCCGVGNVTARVFNQQQVIFAHPASIIRPRCIIKIIIIILDKWWIIEWIEMALYYDHVLLGISFRCTSFCILQQHSRNIWSPRHVRCWPSLHLMDGEPVAQLIASVQQPDIISVASCKARCKNARQLHQGGDHKSVARQ